MDHTLKKVTVSVSGNEPKITVMDPYGKAYIGPPKIIPILDLSDVKVTYKLNHSYKLCFSFYPTFYQILQYSKKNSVMIEFFLLVN